MMWLYNIFSKKIELYKSIDDLPIYNFDKILKSHDLRYLLKEEIKDITYNKNFDKISDQWVKLYDEYLEHFGLSKSYKRVIEQETKIAKLQIQRWLRDDRSLEGIIEVEKIKLQEMNKKKKKKSTFEEDLATIEQNRGIGMNPKETSVKMFFTYVKLMENG